MKSSTVSPSNGLAVPASVPTRPLTNDATQYMQMGVAQLAIPQSWDVDTLIQGQGVIVPATAYVQPRMQQPQQQLLTIYMQDCRADPANPDHLLAELTIPLHKNPNDEWFVNADDMIRRLQGTPGRIDGMAKLSIKRGIYRQLFCRLSTTSIEKCHPENLRVTPDHSIEIIVEPVNQPHTQPPLPPPLKTGASATSNGKRHQSEDHEASESPLAPTPRSKRHKAGVTLEPESPVGMEASSPQMSMLNSIPHGFVESSPAATFSTITRPTYMGGAMLPAQPESVNTNTSEASGPSSAASSSLSGPHSMWRAKPPPNPSTANSPSDSKAADARRNAKNEQAKGIIVPWIRSKIEREEGYDAFSKSKGRILTIQEALRGYRFARAMIQKYNNYQTPADLEGAGKRKVTKVNIWQALDRQTSWGSDAETTLALVEKYGIGAPEEHPKIVEMLNGKWGKDEREGSVLFLNHLKRIDAEAKTSREAGADGQGPGAPLA